MKNIRTIISKNKKIILYILFGVLTTIVNIIIYGLFRYLKCDYQTSYWFGWFFAVLFAYISNRTLVFESTAKGTHQIIKEVVNFYLARIATGVIGSLIMYFGVSILNQNDFIWNIVQNVFVIASNYILSKLIIFK